MMPVHLPDQGLQRLSDQEVLAKATAEGRCLVTMDLDFAYLMAIGRRSLPTIIIRLDDETTDNVIRRLSLVLANHSAELEAGAIFSIDERTVPARPLPI